MPDPRASACRNTGYQEGTAALHLAAAHGPLLGMIVDFVREAAIRDQKFIAEFDQSGRGDQAGANITERVQAITGFDIRRKADDVVRQ